MLDWERIVNHPLFNLGAYFFVYQVTRYSGLDNPENLYSIRTFYLGSQFIIIALSFYLMSVIKKKNDTTVLRYVLPGGKQWNGTSTADTLIETTHMDYDIADVKKQLNQGFTNLAIIAFLHLKYGYIQPLIVQSILSFKTFFLTNEARIHFFGAKTNHGELRRPFRVSGIFGIVNEKNQPKTDKGSIKRAEKALKVQ
ncbi:inorganic phosphate transporter [Pilaira anomala]|nr:inorganic phosphate transporter [Pilaira anomala]